MNIYDLSRKFWDFAFENPDKIKPNHGAMYFFAIEHCNRLGWKERFGFPTVMAMEAIGIKSYNTFINTLKELVEFGFIEMIEKSKNQYSANIIALSNFNEAHNKALDKALIKHSTKQSESTIQSTDESIDSINKQIYNTTNLPIYNDEVDPQEKKIEEESVLFPEIKIDETKQPALSKRKKVAQKKENGKDELQLQIPEDFIELWDEWKEYRKAKKKKPYAGIKWEQKALNAYLELSNNDPDLGRLILDQTTSQNWEGLFKLKQNYEHGKSNNQSTNNGFINNGNDSGKINGRSNPFTVDDFVNPS